MVFDVGLVFSPKVQCLIGIVVLVVVEVAVEEVAGTEVAAADLEVMILVRVGVEDQVGHSQSRV